VLNFKVQSVLGVTSALLLSSAAMASNASVRPIVGGTTVGVNETIAKRTVGLFFILHDGSNGICSGSILDNTRILTAAHCVQNVDAGVVVFSNNNMINLVINASQNGVDAVPQLRLMTGIKQEPGYSGQEGGNDEFNDLAVVTFEGGLPAGYEPAKFLPKASALQVLRRNAAITLAGYGITSAPAEEQAPVPGASPTPAPTPDPSAPPVDDGSGTLRQVTVGFGLFSPNQIDMYVGGLTGHDACSGDSGGPSMITVGGEVYVVGVASRSDCVQMSIYTFVNQEIVSGL
jgi:secreted trypsin-like serine protease